MKGIRTISRIIVGLVFIFSGFVKAIDPLGSTYKFIDYFNAFHLGFLESLAFPLAIILSGIELVLGISLILGYRMKIASWTTLIFMSFFTVLTFILALTNPVHDCGCFGDAIILTNWQTFWKNVVLMFFTFLIFIYRTNYIPVRSKLTESLLIILFFVFSFILSFSCYSHLPIIDFRPYKVGTYIPEAMSIPENAPENVYETSLIYKEISTGKEKEFNLENYPKDTSLWEFSDAKSVLISKGYEPPIHDFNIVSPSGQEITDDVLNFSGYTFTLISYDISKTPDEALIEANQFFNLSQSHKDVRFFAITASSYENTEEKRNNLNLGYDFCLADEITLKTIVRANPGLVLLHNGTILDKWHYRDFPDSEEMSFFEDLFNDYPFCKGCDLNLIRNPPLGSKEDIYESIFLYRSLISDSLNEFTIDNYPQNSAEWIFEDSKSTKIQSGFTSIIDKFILQDYSGNELSESIYFNPGYSLLFFIKDIYSLSEELIKQIVQLGAMSTEYLGTGLKVFAAVDVEGEDLLSVSDQFISSFEYLHIESSAMDILNFESAFAVVIKDGKIIECFKDNEIPDPEILQLIEDNYSLPDASSVISPMVLKELSTQRNKLIIISLTLGFFLFSSMLRIFFSRNKR